MFQRRKFPRVGKNYHVSYTTVDQDQLQDSPIRSLAVNISGGGLCFEASEALEKGAVVALEINSDGFDSAMLALAQVAWCKPRGSSYEVGAEFWWIGWHDSQAQTTMANFISTNASARKVAV